MFFLGKKQYEALNKVELKSSALLHNLKVFEASCPRQVMIPVLKANAYGHGLEWVGQSLDRQNLPFFAVDSLYEAYELKKARVKTPILVMGYNRSVNLNRANSAFTFAAGDLQSLKTLCEKKLPFHLEIDTGMARMGFSLQDLPSALSAILQWKGRLDGVFTHLANADQHDSDPTQSQYAIFGEALALISKAGLEPRWIHVGGSYAAHHAVPHQVNSMRLGIGLYGVMPHPTALQPALRLSSILTAIRILKKGESVSYGSTFRAPREMRIGTIPLGYYEALPRSLSNKGVLEIKGQIRPLIGTICMNHCMVDLGDLEVKLEEPVVLYQNEQGHPCSILAQAEQAGVSPYEMLTRISGTLRRHGQ
jgi:alanine racemase